MMEEGAKQNASQLDEVLAYQSDASRRGQSVSIDELRQRFPVIAANDDFLMAVIYNEYQLCDRESKKRKFQQLSNDFPDHAQRLARQVEFATILGAHVSQSGTIRDAETANSPVTPPEISAKELAANLASVGRFEIMQLLGHGGMGSVFLALDTAMERCVAIKVPRNPGALSHDGSDRFLREARIAAQLHHQHLVEIYDVGQHADGCYLVTRYADAGDLATFLHNHTGQISSKDAVKLMIAIADGVAHCHERNIAHLDIKPGNILFASDCDHDFSETVFPGHPLVTDFGLARLADSDNQFVQTSVLVGTPLYMSPEQIECRRSEIGPVSDVFALGALFYELLTGRRPFSARTSMELVDKLRSGKPDPILRTHKVDEELAMICQRCLQNRPEDRYPSAAELLDDLRRWDSGQPISDYRIPTWKRIFRWCELPERITQAAAVAMAFNIAMLAGFGCGVVYKILGGEVVPGTLGQLVMDALKLSLLPHGPLVVVSWLVLQGRLSLYWLNLVLVTLLVGALTASFIIGESPIAAYDSNPFAFYVSHVLVAGIGLAQLLAHLVAIPAAVAYHQLQRTLNANQT